MLVGVLYELSIWTKGHFSISGGNLVKLAFWRERSFQNVRGGLLRNPIYKSSRVAYHASSPNTQPTMQIKYLTFLTAVLAAPPRSVDCLSVAETFRLFFLPSRHHRQGVLKLRVQPIGKRIFQLP